MGLIIWGFGLSFGFFQKLEFAEHHKMIAVNLLHVLTQGLEPTRVLVMKDILEMGRRVKVPRSIFPDLSTNVIFKPYTSS